MNQAAEIPGFFSVHFSSSVCACFFLLFAFSKQFIRCKFSDTTMNKDVRRMSILTDAFIYAIVLFLALFEGIQREKAANWTQYKRINWLQSACLQFRLFIVFYSAETQLLLVNVFQCCIKQSQDIHTNNQLCGHLEANIKIIKENSIHRFILPSMLNYLLNSVEKLLRSGCATSAADWR